MTIQANVNEFMAGRTPGSREASFDYCFTYFQRAFREDRLTDLVGPSSLELSSLQLGFYLASWGMFRGRAQLLKHSSRFYEPVLKAIVEADERVWTLDVPGYNPETAELVVRQSRLLRAALFPRASDTLVTKIMLGVFGCVPAFDSYFCHAFGHRFGAASLLLLRDQFEADEDAIAAARPYAIDFASGEEQEIRYTSAKVIDMHLFVAGGGPTAAKRG